MEAQEFEVQTEDGRRLIAAEYGPAEGEPLLFHHGSPGSRWLFERHVEEGAERGLRHITYSRPGYEGSDRHPKRTYADSALDSAAVLDALGVECFYTIGISGGGGPALACAALMPDRVRSAVSASALGPREDVTPHWLQGAAEMNVEEFEILEQGEPELEARIKQEVAEWSAVDSVEDLRSGPLEEMLCEADKNLSDDYSVYQVEGCKKFDTNQIWGWFDDDWAMWMGWGFDLSRITVPVTIWQGGRDKLVPPQNGKWLAAAVPGATLRLRKQTGHMSLFDRYYGEMLDDLIASART